MKAGPPFARVGSFPAKDDPPLGAALALLDQRTHDKFDALDAVDGDVVSPWKVYSAKFNPSTIGNGRLQAQYRFVGEANAGYRFFLEIGSTTVIHTFGFGVAAPPLYKFDVRKLAVPKGQTAGVVTVTYAGLIGAQYKGGVLPALITPDGAAGIQGPALNSLGAGDRLTIEVELPIRKVGT